MTQTTTGFPATADAWLVPTSKSRVLCVGRSSAGIAARLSASGSQVSFIAESTTELATAQRRFPAITVVAAAGEALPFPPSSFDAVVITQACQLLSLPAAAEFARVLAPNGNLGLAHTSRDDSVPWVRRLAKVLQAHDPALMTGKPISAPGELAACPHFPQVEQHTFRTWVPITRQGMLDMVAAAPKLAALPEPHASRLLAQVAEIYDSSARNPEPLSLPYAVQCWRAVVDHTEFTSQLHLPEAGLQILL